MAAGEAIRVMADWHRAEAHKQAVAHFTAFQTGVAHIEFVPRDPRSDHYYGTGDYEPADFERDYQAELRHYASEAATMHRWFLANYRRRHEAGLNACAAWLAVTKLKTTDPCKLDKFVRRAVEHTVAVFDQYRYLLD
jgi:hypothetical protein